MKMLGIILSLVIGTNANAFDSIYSFYSSPFGVKVRVIDSFQGKKMHGQQVVSNIVNIYLPEHFDISYNYTLSTAHVVNKEVQKDMEQDINYILASSDTKQTLLFMASFMEELENAGKDGVKVVNYSSAGETFAEVEQREIVRILNQYDMILVTAAGNNGNKIPNYPCNYASKRIVCVGSATIPEEIGVYLEKENYKPEKFSNRGNHVDFYAYGRAFLGGEKGTSFSTPKVTAALLLIMSNFPNKSPLEAVAYLKEMGKFVSTADVATKVQTDIKGFSIDWQTIIFQ